MQNFKSKVVNVTSNPAMAFPSSYQSHQQSQVPHYPQTHVSVQVPSGTLAPGTLVRVGKYSLEIERYLAEGGYAHVYLVRVTNTTETAVLKRVVVPDKERLTNVQREIEFMKQLGGHKNIVRYIDSEISSLPSVGYQVFILMENCAGGGVIDLMNRRLQTRLTEPEILKIFSDVCEALAYMHYQRPPILHRDLKIENILASSNDCYKLCDFGSAVIYTGDNTPRTLQAIQTLEDDINRHTTLQYRAPEMVDLYLKRPINEKADIWALGVLLYKLCFYTTPFEAEGQLAILSARYSIPSSPVFSSDMISLIVSMLKEDYRQRPTIYDTLKAVCKIRGTEVPIGNIYAESSKLYTSATMAAPFQDSTSIFQARVELKPELPEITPMRRGRPIRQERPTSQNIDIQNKPTTSFDPFDPSQRPHSLVGLPSTAFPDISNKASDSSPSSQLTSIPRSVSRDSFENTFPPLDAFGLPIFSEKIASAVNSPQSVVVKLPSQPEALRPSTSSTRGGKTMENSSPPLLSSVTSSPSAKISISSFDNQSLRSVSSQSSSQSKGTPSPQHSASLQSLSSLDPLSASFNSLSTLGRSESRGTLSQSHSSRVSSPNTHSSPTSSPRAPSPNTSPLRAPLPRAPSPSVPVPPVSIPNKTSSTSPLIDFSSSSESSPKASSLYKVSPQISSSRASSHTPSSANGSSSLQVSSARHTLINTAAQPTPLISAPPEKPAQPWKPKPPPKPSRLQATPKISNVTSLSNLYNDSLEVSSDQKSNVRSSSLPTAASQASTTSSQLDNDKTIEGLDDFQSKFPPMGILLDQHVEREITNSISSTSTKSTRSTKF